PMSQAEDPGVAPDQVHRQGHRGVAEDLAPERDRVVGEVERAGRGSGQVQERHQYGEHRVAPGQDGPGAARVQRARLTAGRRSPRAREGCAEAGKAARHRRHYGSSAARPRSAKRPWGRRWMNRMMNTGTTIFASTAPAIGSRTLLARPSPAEATMVPASCPTPPSTTTMNESTMKPCPSSGPTFPICESAQPPRPAMPDPSANATR